jgi:hypothetical protein
LCTAGAQCSERALGTAAAAAAVNRQPPRAPASLDLATLTRKHALSNALQATAARRALLKSRDDVALAGMLGCASRATTRR